MRQKSPYKVVHLSVRSFRGVDQSGAGTVLPGAFVEMSWNAVSRNLGEMRQRYGQNLLGVAVGQVLGAQRYPEGTLMAFGTGVILDVG